MHIFCKRGLHSPVHLVHIGPMNELQEWMQSKHLKDKDLAKLTQGAISRSQISRIRRGQSSASPVKAMALEAVTGIPWHAFVNARMQ